MSKKKLKPKTDMSIEAATIFMDSLAVMESKLFADYWQVLKPVVLLSQQYEQKKSKPEIMTKITMSLSKEEIRLLRNVVSDLGTSHLECVSLQLKIESAILDALIMDLYAN
jgi:hypothetical protein